MTLRGPDGMRLWLQTWLDAAPDGHAALERIFGEGDWVATEHHGTATHTGPLRTPTGEIPPTGRKLESLVQRELRGEGRQAAPHARLLRRRGRDAAVGSAAGVASQE